MIKLLLPLLLWSSSYLFAQESNPILVNIEIIGRGDLFDKSKADSNYYFTRFEVTNIQDTALPITVWNCSWNCNWRSDTDSIRISGWGCDGNYPETIMVSPKKSLVFYGTVYFKKSNKIRHLKLGFANCSKEFKDYGVTFISDPKNPEGKIFWSNEIELKDSYSNEIYLK